MVSFLTWLFREPQGVVPDQGQEHPGGLLEGPLSSPTQEPRMQKLEGGSAVGALAGPAGDSEQPSPSTTAAVVKN